jgi:hypothetical protein
MGDTGSWTVFARTDARGEARVPWTTAPVRQVRAQHDAYCPTRWGEDVKGKPQPIILVMNPARQGEGGAACFKWNLGVPDSAGR